MGIFINLSNQSMLDKIPFGDDVDPEYTIKTYYNPNRHPTFIDEHGDLVAVIDGELYVIQDDPLPKELYEKYPVYEYDWLPKDIKQALSYKLL